MRMNRIIIRNRSKNEESDFYVTVETAGGTYPHGRAWTVEGMTGAFARTFTGMGNKGRRRRFGDIDRAVRALVTEVLAEPWTSEPAAAQEPKAIKTSSERTFRLTKSQKALVDGLLNDGRATFIELPYDPSTCQDVAVLQNDGQKIGNIPLYRAMQMI